MDHVLALDTLDKDSQAEYWASLALRHAVNVGVRSHKKLLAFFGSALAAIQNPREWPDSGVEAGRATAILSDSWRESAKQEWEKARRFPGGIVLWTSPDYPQNLRELPDAPVLLYIRGQRSLLQAPKLAVVGTRNCSPEGAKAAAYFSRALSAAGVSVVSGLAMGIDQAAHEAALLEVGSTISVLGCGVDVVYPPDAADLHARIGRTGLLLSEFAPGSNPVAANFPVRNRIISGLSLGTLVVEAAPQSGSLITARLALEHNRAVYAVPGGLGSTKARGCQELIRQGARPVFEARDILEDLFTHLRQSLEPQPQPTQKKARAGKSVQAVPQTVVPAPAANSPEAKVCHLLANSPEAIGLEALCEYLNREQAQDGQLFSPAKLNALLLRMEVKGMVRRLPGMLYTL